MYWFLLAAFLLVVVAFFYVISQQQSSLPEKPVVVETEDSVPAPVIPNPAEEMLQSFYTPAREKVELDFPPKKIGCCPFSKPASTDLPIGNIPMCYASVSQTHLKQI